jgi:hypothetical protein
MGLLMLGGLPLSAAQPQEQEPVKAYFIGYEGNDLVFKIINEESFDIEIKGLTFRKQVLYRPVEKTIIAGVGKEREPHEARVVFRSPEDFVWSQNHMAKFRLAYDGIEEAGKQRRFVRIYPENGPEVE